MDHLCYLWLLPLFIAALWSLAGKGLTYWLSFVMLNYVFVTFPYGILGQVWYLIVSIPDLCCLSYFLTTTFFLYFLTIFGYSRQLRPFMNPNIVLL